MSDVALFKNAGLTPGDIAQHRQALQRTQATRPSVGGTPFLKMDPDDGTWIYGQEEIVVEEGSEWAVNPLSMKKGWVAWPKKGGAPLARVVGSVFKPLPQLADMEDVGADYQESIEMGLRCLNGEDKDTEITFNSNALGAVEAFHDLLALIDEQLGSNPAYLVPVIALTNTSYEHSNRAYGTVYKPVFEVKYWVDMAGNKAGAAPVKVVNEPRDAEADAQASQDEQAAAAGQATGRGRGRRAAAEPEPQAPAEPPARGRGRRAAAPEPAAPAEPVQRRRRRAAS